jgi:hypothetical protein
LEYKKKVVANSPRNALKTKNRVEEGGTSGLRVKREHESTKIKGIKNDEGWSGTICSANSGIGNANGGTCN